MSHSQPILYVPGYRIEREIGKGAMASAYLAIQESLEREVALKIMSPALVEDQTFHKRFLTEGKLIAKLNHPNIVNVYDIGITDNSIFYMALEYACGGNLTQRIQQGLTVVQALQILRQLTSALDYAHRRGIVHRDVKPHNILFRDPETAILSDFGIAKTLDTSNDVTAVGWVVGSPGYMSPEQALGHRVGPLSDLYSLGIVFYEMLQGKRPNRSSWNAADGASYNSLGIPQLPSKLARFQPIIDGLLAPDPLHRCHSAEALLQDIASLDEGIQIHDDQTVRRQQDMDATRPWNPDADNRVASTYPGTGGGLDQEQTTITTEPVTQSLFPPATSTSKERAIDSESHTRRRQLARMNGLYWVVALVSLSAVGIGLYWFSKQIGSADPETLQQLVRIDGPSYFVREKEQYLSDLASTYQAMLKLEPNNETATQGLGRIADKYAELSLVSWQKLDIALSLELIYAGLKVVPDHKRLQELQNKIVNSGGEQMIDGNDRSSVWQWIREADEHLAESRFIFPNDKNAVASYRKVLTVDPHNEIAQRRIDDMARVFHRLAQPHLDRGDLESAITYIEQGLFISPHNSQLLALQRRVKQSSR